MNFYEEELIVRRLAVSLREHREGHVFTDPRRERATLFFVLDGQLEISTGENTVSLGRGEGAYIPRGISTRTFYISEYNKTLNFFYDELEGSLGGELCAFGQYERAVSFASEVAEELTREGALDNNYIHHAFYKLLWLISASQKTDRKHLKMHSLRLELETHYYENLSIADYARAYLMSESCLRLRFREYTGKSVIHYRNLVRLRRAEELIRDGMGVGEAALAVGFSSVTFYCRLAKKYRRSDG